MKDEINKIIQSISDFYKLDNALKYYLDRHKAQILLDYITNLQNLCNKYEEEHSTEFKIWKDERHQLLDYKSRNEKAIEYIKKEEKANPDSNRKDVGLILMNYKRVLNILKGKEK